MSNTVTAKRLDLVKPSASMVVSQAARAMIRNGEDVIDLGLGEPDFDTPAHVIEAAHQAALAGQTRYTATDGGPEIKAAVREKFRRDNGLHYAPELISVSNGSKQVLFNALMACVNAGEQVLILAPYFVSYPDMVNIIGAQPLVVACTRDDGFKITPERLRASITPQTRALILNMPCNPTGAVYSEVELQALGAVLDDYPELMIFSDEIYEHILFDELAFTSFAAACPQLAGRTIVINGVSKAYAMTGWRIGFGAGPAEVIAAMAKVQSQCTTGPCSISQAAAAAALTGPQDFVSQACREFEARRDLVMGAVNAIDGLSVAPPPGAFYAYIDCESCIGRTTPNGERIDDDGDFASYLLNTAKVAAVPGAAYGLEPYFRISTATSQKLLQDAVARIADAVGRLG